MEERDFFTEREMARQSTLNCPHCRTQDTYDLKWIVRTKKPSLPGGRASDDDKRRFAAARSYSVRRDDMVMCKNPRCRKRFEVSGIQSVAFDQ